MNTMEYRIQLQQLEDIRTEMEACTDPERRKALHDQFEKLYQKMEDDVRMNKTIDELRRDAAAAYQTASQAVEKSPERESALTLYNDTARALNMKSAGETVFPMYNGCNLEEIRKFLSTQNSEPTPQPAGAFETGDHPARVTGKRDYRSVFHAEARGPVQLDNGGFRSFDEFAHVLISQRFDPRIQTLEQRTWKQNGQGGIMVPEVLAAQLFDVALEDEIVRPRCTLYGMDADNITVPGFNSFNHTNGQMLGGITFQFLQEDVAATDQTGQMVEMQLQAKYLGAYTSASLRLVQTSNFAQALEKALRDAIGWALDYYCLQGTGAGQPMGIINDSSTITIPKVVGQSADSVVYQNLTRMFARLYPGCVKNSAWLAHPSTIPYLTDLYSTSSNPYIAVTGGPTNTQGFNILTRPVIITEKLPAVGDKGDICLVDLSQYVMGMRGNIILDISNSPKWYEHGVSFRCIVPFDGQGAWNAPITPAAGDTLSWCVTLEERA